MPTLIQIPDSAINDAVNAIVLFRGRNEADPNPKYVEQQIRSYIYLGINKLIPDWSYKLTSAQKDSIVTQTINRIQDQYSIRQPFAWIYTNFEIMETLSGTGDLQTNVARPREAQETYEAQLVEAHANDQNPVVAGIENFFGLSKTAIEAALKGLGLNIPLETIIIILVALAVIILLKRSAVI
jgi:hypothetical protein